MYSLCLKHYVQVVKFIAGKEFTPFGMEGDVLIMSKALCTSGKRFHEVFADMLSIEGFTPC